MTATVDAIVCYHNHRDVIADCLASLDMQVRQCLIVDDGSDDPVPFGLPEGTILARDHQHSVANSFNYGAKYSNADWLLYVDPHCRFQPKTVANLLKAAGDDYDFVFGMGANHDLDPADPWAPALATLDTSPPVPLTFLIQRTLWTRWGGIPEPPYCHMQALQDKLLQEGILIATVTSVCTHERRTDLWGFFKAFWMNGYSFAAASGRLTDDAPSTKLARTYTPDHLAWLFASVCAGLQQLGAVAGLNRIPTAPIPAKGVGLYWTVTKPRSNAPSAASGSASSPGTAAAPGAEDASPPP